MKHPHTFNLCAAPYRCTTPGTYSTGMNRSVHVKDNRHIVCACVQLTVRPRSSLLAMEHTSCGAVHVSCVGAYLSIVCLCKYVLQWRHASTAPAISWIARSSGLIFATQRKYMVDFNMLFKMQTSKLTKRFWSEHWRQARMWESKGGYIRFSLVWNRWALEGDIFTPNTQKKCNGAI